MDQLDRTVHLGVPTDPSSIAVVRSVVASVASRLALPYDAVDDLRIAAAEAAAMLIAVGPSGSRLCVDLRPSAQELQLTIWVEGSGQPAEIVDRDALAWRVIEGLTDGSDVSDVDGDTSIELRIRTVSS